MKNNKINHLVKIHYTIWESNKKKVSIKKEKEKKTFKNVQIV